MGGFLTSTRPALLDFAGGCWPRDPQREVPVGPGVSVRRKPKVETFGRPLRFCVSLSPPQRRDVQRGDFRQGHNTVSECTHMRESGTLFLPHGQKREGSFDTFLVHKHKTQAPLCAPKGVAAEMRWAPPGWGPGIAASRCPFLAGDLTAPQTLTPSYKYTQNSGSGILSGDFPLDLHRPGTRGQRCLVPISALTWLTWRG